MLFQHIINKTFLLRWLTFFSSKVFEILCVFHTFSVSQFTLATFQVKKRKETGRRGRRKEMLEKT